MAGQSRTFSDSWYRVADVKAALLPNIKVHKQRFRGELWYVLQDPFNNKFYRLAPDAYDFVAHLNHKQSIEQVWLNRLEHRPEQAPGQEEVIQLLSSLHQANMLYYESPSDSEQLFSRYHTSAQREMKAKLASFMFMRIPLWDPNDWLTKVTPLFRPLFGWFGGLLWLAVVLAAIKVGIDHAPELGNQTQSVLAPSNWMLLYLAMIFIKTLHELGHAIICRHYGGEVHVMGVMLILFTPLPYMDATSSWSFRNRWHRALVGAGGMLIELFIAAIAVFVWANTGEGTLHSLAYNVIFIASLSTLIFNANPLLKFDGYYIFSDVIDVPNLYDRSRKQVRYFAERYLLNNRHFESPANTLNAQLGLATFATTSAIYRFFVFIGIITFVSDQFLMFGIIMALFMAASWGIKPPYQLIKYLITSPQLSRQRPRIFMLFAGAIALVLILLTQVPMSDRFQAPGVIQAQNHLTVTNSAPGYVAKVLVDSNNYVLKGTPLIQLQNTTLPMQIEQVDAQLRQVLNEERKARSGYSENLAPLKKRKKSLEEQKRRLLDMKKNLIVVAEQDGLWVASGLRELTGQWLSRGQAIGDLIDTNQFIFSSVVAQDEASDLFDDEITASSIRLYGQTEQQLEVSLNTIIPFQQQRLPSPALSWRAGGPIETKGGDQSGLETAEPFFRIDSLLASNASAQLFHGQTGKIQLKLKDKPLFAQWERDFRQIMQRRYQL